MRHPALTRFFAAFLAVMSAITLISGAVCIKKAGSSREKQNTNTARLSEKAAEARALCAEIEDMAPDHEELNEQYDEEKARYDEERLSYRKDLSIYTATEAGLKQGREKLEEGYAALRMGWIGHDNGEKALDEAEAQFRPGYEQYLQGKKQLEEGRKKLEQAEALSAVLPDTALLRTTLDAVRTMKGSLETELALLRQLRENPPRDPDTGEIDREAFLSALDARARALSEKLSSVRETLVSAYTVDDLERAFAPTAAALNELRGRLSDGSLSVEELISSAGELADTGEKAELSTDEALARADEILTLLESLPEMRAQLDQAEAALRESEPMLLQAKEKFEEGRRQLDKAKEALIVAEAQLIAGKKELENKESEQKEKKEELDRRKAALEEEAARLEELLGGVEEYRDRKDRFSNLRYALLADEGIASRQRAGEELLDGAEHELALRRAETQREYELRLASAVGMISASACGALAVAAAFREKRRLWLLLGSALAFLLAAAAEGVSFCAGRGMIYTVLFVGVFAAPLFALNVKKA